MTVESLCLQEMVVCGHSLEMNVTSSLDLFLSAAQVQLLQQLLQANVGLTSVDETAADVRQQTQIRNTHTHTHTLLYTIHVSIVYERKRLLSRRLTAFTSSVDLG